MYTKLTLIKKHTYKSINCLILKNPLSLTFQDNNNNQYRYHLQPGILFILYSKTLKLINQYSPSSKRITPLGALSSTTYPPN